MKTSNVFSTGRFGELIRQFVLHNYQSLLMGMLVVLGLSTIITGIFKIMGGVSQTSDSVHFALFLFGYFILGGFYISSAFSSFRSKEKAFGYLMTPGSVLEKYIVEFIFYPLLFVVLYPVLFMLGYELSTFIASVIRSNPFQPFDMLGFTDQVFYLRDFEIVEGEIREVSSTSAIGLGFSIIFAIAMMFFLGAVSFSKYPLLKTLFFSVVYVGVCTWLVYFFMGYLEWGRHFRLTSEDAFFSPIGSEGVENHTIVTFFGLFLLLFGIVFMVVSFMKLKEKEV